MWQEARKQEKHIKTLMVDYRKRAERRRDYYERIKQDPIKFLRVYGRPSKLHLDSETVKAAENPNNMMSWIGDPTILIDRFDARANLEHWENQVADEPKLTSVERIEHRLCMYERYRCLIHNDYAGVSELMALKQIESDEKFGDLDKKRKEEEETSKKSQEPKAAIGFVYEDSTAPVSQGTAPAPDPVAAEDSESDGEADSDMDIDVELDLATLGADGRRQLAQSAATFGLHPTDFVRLLNADQQLETELRLAKALEEEKLQLAGRKSRRARRLLKERRAKERFPKMLTTKVGLLNGQPISRRTVYLSASSSDSGDYPSDEAEEDVTGLQYRNSKAADVRARRARAKPMLTNARGPSVLIGGMTSISLCRRRSNAGLDTIEKMRKAGARSSSSSNSSESSANGRRGSSSSSDRSRRGRRSRALDGRHRGKRSRVEYITTFGDNDDDRGDKSHKSGARTPLSGAPWKDENPCTATSAMAASVVSKVLYSSKKDPSVGRLDTSSVSRYIRRETRNRSSSSESYRRRNRRSPARKYRSHSSRSSSSKSSIDLRRRSRRRSSCSSSSRSWSHIRGTHSVKRARRSSSRSNSSLHRSLSRSPLSQRLSSSGRRNDRTSPDVSRHSLESAGMNPPRDDPVSSPPVRKRYYRPELESEEESILSEEASEEGSTTSIATGNRRPDNSGAGAFAGKMATSSHTDGDSHSNFTKPASGSVPVDGIHLTPQELLKRRVQLQLTKAFNAAKQAELEKQLQLEKERQAREEGLRRQAQLIRRQEERRLREENRVRGAAGGHSSDSSSSSASPVDSSRSKAKPPSTSSQRSPPRRSHTLGPRKSPSIHGRRTPNKSPTPTATNRLPSPPSNSVHVKFSRKDFRGQQSGSPYSTRPVRARNFHPDRGYFSADRERYSSHPDRYPGFDRQSHSHRDWTSPPHWPTPYYGDHRGVRGRPWTLSDNRRLSGRTAPWSTSGSRSTPSARYYPGRYS
ncbi:unnamed protein product [Dicrocoelium dendriticum]|nr:unnamed protein product [Dicrocoelium dendriticum]